MATGKEKDRMKGEKEKIRHTTCNHREMCEKYQILHSKNHLVLAFQICSMDVYILIGHNSFPNTNSHYLYVKPSWTYGS